MLSLLIFTDLDGTLLDHDSYSYRGAADTLGRLRRLSIPLILTSSKTRAEIKHLQRKLGLDEPFISENGGGLFLPEEYQGLPDIPLAVSSGCRGVVFGRPYAYVREIFGRLRDRYALRGFGDMSTEEIMQATGLGREEALLAAQRDFSEPFLFMAAPRPREMEREAAAWGLAVTSGGRFYHLMGAGQDKGRAVEAAAALFREKYGSGLRTVGLGDARNDYPMLRAVDIPVLMPGPDGSYAEMDIEGLRRAPLPGSRGWGIIIAKLLDDVAAAGETGES